MTLKLACKFSEPSSSDKEFSKVSTQLTKIASASSYGDHLIPEYTPISSQGRLGSCVANGVCDAFEMLLGLQDQNKVIQLSRLFVYWNSRCYHKATDQDDGTYIRYAMDSLQTLGVCQEKTWQYDENKVFSQPSIWSYSEGNDNKITDYYRITSTGNERLDLIESAVRSNHPVIFGVPVSKEFTETYDVGQYPIFSFPKTSIGRHCMLVVGIKYINNKRHFIIRNSWGKYWGDGTGHAALTEDYLKSEECNDIWVATNIPNLLF